MSPLKERGQTPLKYQKGKELFGSFLKDGYKNVKDNYGGDNPHTSCKVYRVFDSEEFYEFALVNSNGRINSLESKINKISTKFFNDEIEKYHGQSNEFIKFTDSDPFFDEDDFDRQKELLDEDMFYELSKYVDFEK